MIKIVKNKIPLYILTLILFIYSFADLQSSSVTGNAGTNRSTVYISLIGLVFFLLSYIFIKTKMNITINKIQLSILLITIWIFFVGIIRGSNLWTLFLHMGLSFLWFLSYTFFEYLAKKGKITYNSIAKIFYILFIFYVISLIYYFIDLYILKGRIPVSNLIYNILVLFPWLINSKSKLISKSSIILVIISVFLSMKRSALIVLPMILLIHIIGKGIVSRKNISYFFKIFGLFLGFIILFFITDYLSDGFLSSRFTAEALSSGSGRDVIYSKAIDNIKNRNFFDLLIGFGSGSSIAFIGTGVHNEWLEFGFSFGVIGVLLYLNLIISLIICITSTRKLLPEYYYLCLGLVVYILVIGFLGGIYFMHATFYLFGFFGLIKGMTIRKQMLIR